MDSKEAYEFLGSIKGRGSLRKLCDIISEKLKADKNYDVRDLKKEDMNMIIIMRVFANDHLLMQLF
jgi:hypothetical protein